MRRAFSLDDLWKGTSLSPTGINSTAREFVGLQAKASAMEGMLERSPYNASKNNAVLIFPPTEYFHLDAASKKYAEELPGLMAEPIKKRDEEFKDRKISMSLTQLNASL